MENTEEYFKDIQFDDKIDTNKYSINLMGHHQNFILMGGYSNSNLTEKHWDSNGARDYKRDYQRDAYEAQFQISIKIPLYSNFLGTKADLFTAYTQNSYWQVYDSAHSSPFRENNYMPELFLEWQPDTKMGDSTLKKVRLAVIHQSNGQDIGQSRSWNRTELHLLFQNSHLLYGLNLWDRWNEKTKTDYSQIEGDDNEELEKYIGKQKYFIKYKTKKYSLALAYQNDIFNYHKSLGNTKIDITFPSINKNFDFFIRYFHGYGESLIDYDVKVNRVSFGVIVANWN